MFIYVPTRASTSVLAHRAPRGTLRSEPRELGSSEALGTAVIHFRFFRSGASDEHRAALFVYLALHVAAPRCLRFCAQRNGSQPAVRSHQCAGAHLPEKYGGAPDSTVAAAIAGKYWMEEMHTSVPGAIGAEHSFIASVPIFDERAGISSLVEAPTVGSEGQ